MNQNRVRVSQGSNCQGRGAAVHYLVIEKAKVKKTKRGREGKKKTTAWWGGKINCTTNTYRRVPREKGGPNTDKPPGLIPPLNKVGGKAYRGGRPNERKTGGGDPGRVGGKTILQGTNALRNKGDGKKGRSGWGA